MKKETKEIRGMIDELEIKLEEVFGKKIWNLPKKVKEVIVTIAPYLAIISLIALIPMILSLVGLSFLTPMAFLGGIKTGFGYMTSVLTALMGGILSLVAIPGLFKREIKA